MKNLRIRTSIALSLLLPILGLIVFSGSMVLDKRQTAAEMQGLEKLAKLAPVISNMVHELQVERGFASVFITSKGKRFKDELPAQFPATDNRAQALIEAFHNYDASIFNVEKSAEALAQEQAAQSEAEAAPAKDDGEEGPKLIPLAQNVSNPLVEQMNRAIVALHAIEETRGKTLKRRLIVLRMAKYYNDTIAELLAIVEQMGTLSSDARTTNAVIAYANFLQFKEFSGIERDLGSAAFSAKKFKFFIYKGFVEVIARQETILASFMDNAKPDQVRFMSETVTGPTIEEVDGMRVIATASSQNGFSVKEIDPVQWDEAITAKIVLLKTVEDRLAEDLVALVHGILVDAESAFSTLLAITLALLGVTLTFVIFVVRSITQPVSAMAGAMNLLANGELQTEIPAQGRSNEIGQMAKAVQMFKDNALRNKELEAKAEEEKRKAEEDKREMMMQTASDFEASVGAVVDSVAHAAHDMQESATSLSSTAEQTSQQAANVASASEEASSNVQTVASAAEELSSSISEISRQVAQSTQIAGAAVAEVDGANQKVQGLADAANKIGEVVALITDIADQTNLLALNATIEAARAGEAGKGFAVVASEVKNLANQTAKATEEISSQIGGIQGATQEAVAAIGSIGGTIAQMNEIASAIAAAVEEQGAATQEIARNVEQAASGTHQVSSNITMVNQAADQTGSSAQHMLTSANELSDQAKALRQEVDTFLINIRSG